MITHSRALTLETAGRSRAVFNYCAGVSGRWGCVSEPGHLLGGGPRAAWGWCASLPALWTRHVPGIPAGAATLSPVISRKVSLCHPPGEGGLFQENEREGEKKNTQVIGFFLFSLELNITQRPCKRKGLLVGEYGFTSQPLSFGFESEAMWWWRKHQQKLVIGPQEIHSGVFVLLNEQHCCL